MSMRYQVIQKSEIRHRVLWFCLSGLLSWLASPAHSGALFGDPNQPYDKLPGTYETWHMNWATPLADGKLKVLFIIPYMNSREVVELRQRLDLDYTVIMNVGKSEWTGGANFGAACTAIQNGETVLNQIVTERLALGKTYDCIVIGKVSWEAIPKNALDLILEHVARGTALVYVSPHRQLPPQLVGPAGATKDTDEPVTPDPQFNALFRGESDTALTRTLQASLPLDRMPLKWVSGWEDFRQLTAPPPAPGTYQIPAQQAVSVRRSQHGKGTIVALDYYDLGGSQSSDKSLTPCVKYERAIYDLSHALLAKCVLAAVRGKPQVAASITIGEKSPAVAIPEDTSKLEWRDKKPAAVLSRPNLGDATVALEVLSGARQAEAVILDWAVRDDEGNIMSNGQAKVKTQAGQTVRQEVKLPILPRGDYFLDLRVLNAKGAVLDFCCRSFRVETDDQVTSVTTDREYYTVGQKIEGKVDFARPLAAGLNADANAIDPWGRVVARAPVRLDNRRSSGEFTLPVELPLARLWDIQVEIRDQVGIVDSRKIWVGLPNWNFDEYIMPLTFGPRPGGDGWKGNYYAEAVRHYGVNGAMANVIYGATMNYEDFERTHLLNITYAGHLGQPMGPEGKEYSDFCLAEMGRMALAVADTGKPLDPKEHPYQADWMNAGMINGAIRDYAAVSKFGSPLFILAGESYLSCEGQTSASENSCFCPLCTKNFQDWCRQKYQGDLHALNAEWGTDFKSWEEIRGILLSEAVKARQLPRWVAFRYFMRSAVWTQFFLDWTEMMSRVIGHDVNTGTIGHDHYDFTRCRTQWTSAKVYAGCNLNFEYKEAVREELNQSFSGDCSFLVGSHSVSFWDGILSDPLENQRFPWQILFAGYRGFDWEAAFPDGPSMGGFSCLTPDLSEPLPFFKNLSAEVLILQRGIGKLCNTAKPLRSPVAILWSPVNNYISRLLPRQKNAFSSGQFANVSVDGGAIGDCLALMKNLRIRPTFVGPEDVIGGDLEKRGFKALLLPYNKGMGVAEAQAIRLFVEKGGLVIADNEPGTYSQFGKKLEKPLLADLFPLTDGEKIVPFGKGVAAYLGDRFNGYVGRMEAGDYAGSDSVAFLLQEHAQIAAPVELIDDQGKPRRDTLMPVYLKGSARYVGLIRASTSKDKEVEGTTVNLGGKYHVWDGRKQQYLGYTESFKYQLDMLPKFFALWPANPTGITVKPEQSQIKAGDTLKLAVAVAFAGGDEQQIAHLGQVVHVEVLGPGGQELEWYRDNVLFEGKSVSIPLPVSFSEKPGAYTVRVEHPITGMKAETKFKVK